MAAAQHLRSDEAMDGSRFRNIVGFLGSPTKTDGGVDTMDQHRTIGYSVALTAQARAARSIIPSGSVSQVCGLTSFMMARLAPPSRLVTPALGPTCEPARAISG